MIDPRPLVQAFHERHGREPRLFHAPGRVNLIGEHTDYHDGFVLPLAIDRGTTVAAAAREDRLLRATSADASDEAIVDLDAPSRVRRGAWIDYLEGVARLIEERIGPLRGADLLVRGDVPIGSGLSSSASLEVALALALLTLSEHSADRTVVARLCQDAEHRFVGTRCGIMDQLAAATGLAGHALLIDCRTLETTPIPLPADQAAVLVCDSGVRHRLSASAYNERRAESEEAARQLAQGRPERQTLRDVTPEELSLETPTLAPLLRRRARHVVGEIDRTRRGARALQAGDFDAFGALMAESHRSLRDDYEVSAPELDALADAAMATPGVYGSRMTGGGFGGCTVSLIRPEAAPRVGQALESALMKHFGRRPEWFVTTAAAGAVEQRPGRVRAT